MKLSNEFLSLQFTKIADEYTKIGLYREADLARAHAKDVRRLQAPRVLYVDPPGGEAAYFFRKAGTAGRTGPFRTEEQALQAAYVRVLENLSERLLAVVRFRPQETTEELGQRLQTKIASAMIEQEAV